MVDSNESLEKAGIKFKEICLLSNELEINKALDSYLDPECDLDVSEKSFKLLKSYISGGLNYEKFKSESIIRFLF
jgi:hypothetical protein